MSLPIKFRQIKPLPSGHFATVTGCEDSNGNVIALKKLKKEHAANSTYRERFHREIQITSALADLDGVVRIIESGEHDGLPYYTMSLADGNLYKYVQHRNSELDVASRIKICRSFMSTMANAHARGTLHRDLSPTNILVYVSSEGIREVVVADFGLGKSDDQLKNLTTSSHANYGQALYVAPEQRDRLLQATKRSDVYSLGRVLDYVMTGRDPDNAEGHAMRVISRRATQHDPQKRYADAGEMLTAYDSQASLVLGSGEEDIQFVSDLQNLVEPFSWQVIHRILVQDESRESAYHDYLNPVLIFFSDSSKWDSYIVAIGENVDEFAVKFADMVGSAGGQRGWSFDEARRFYPMLEKLILQSHGSDAKIKCFEQLWIDAYRADRYAAQDSVVRILKGKKLPGVLHAEIAAKIVELGGYYVSETLLRNAPVGPIRNAIQVVLNEKK